MVNFFDYLHWRGDLDFSVSPFNEVDAAILAMLSYVNLSGVVPGWDSGLAISIKDTADQVFSKFSATETGSKASSEIIPTINSKFNSNLEEMLRKLSGCPRFEAVRLSGFEENTDIAAGRQFAAVTFTLSVGCPRQAVAFRGTDNTLVGWKEDFGIVYMEQIPAQDSAQKYLEQALEKLSGQFIVCGHSKGGNLAVFAGSHVGSNDQNRISRIYNFDGPGFNFSVMDQAPFILCENKIFNFVPEESMVGMLFDSVGKRTVISSSARNVNQHNAFNWHVEPTGFVRGNLGDVAKLLEHILNSWVSDISLPERQAFLEAFFDLLGDTEETVISMDPLQTLREITKFLKKYKQLDKETKSLMNLVFGSLSAQTKRTVSTTIRQKLPGKLG